MGRKLIYLFFPFLILSALTPTALASPIQPETNPLPLVVWHGLGDSYENEGMKSIAQLAEEVNPGTYVYLIRFGESGTQDRDATFFGNVTAQVEDACQQLASDPIISSAPAINALGFSQGGQFLRAYAQRCNNPPVHNLVTFGSQHNGIASFTMCKDSGDWLCWSVNALLRFGTWSGIAQSGLVPAQYFRDPEEMGDYLEYSNFLADINNERVTKNEKYKENLKKLNKFVMYMFKEDTTVVPKESAHFMEVNATSGEHTKLQDRPIYKEDWLGLKVLDEQARLEFLTIPGRHMQLSGALLKNTFRSYFGPLQSGETEKTPEASFQVQES
ncbi:palmitoyl-protein thioesterase 1 [Arthroderma uncinatum]|uniref:palmitoyl-protein thioesterase 1 n=1 Tax=Arthroderma uncinatum TaxID=74035 RepID=UPI00144AD006|nr:palmitoyl-protein thioesterase 1 [Arthroderma uncinatum]KAF3491031.1 palmitoyl-protein thioesterase 1 [Arthroderma uncinatum]